MENFNISQSEFKTINNKQKKFTLIIHHAYLNETQRFDDILNDMQINNQDKISLNEIFQILKNRGFDYFSNIVSYLDTELNSFIYCGILPFLSSVSIPFSSIVELKVRQLIKKDNLMRMELREENIEENENSGNVFINAKSKRAKERKIGYIIEKVFLWRKLYNGFQDENGNLVKLTLEEAAEKVGISKKSLDDYLIQLR